MFSNLVTEALEQANATAQGSWTADQLKRIKKEMHQAYKQNDQLWFAKDAECIISGCPDNAIKSHVIQRAVLERTLGESVSGRDGINVSTPKWNQEQHSFVGGLTSIDKAMTFAGFCKFHDKSLFENMEAETLRIGHIPAQFVELQLARSFYRELRRLTHEVESALTLRSAYSNIECSMLIEILNTHLKAAIGSEWKQAFQSSPLLKHDFLHRWGNRFTEFDAAMSHKKRLLDGLKKMEPGMRRALVGGSPRPECLIFGWLLDKAVPFAVSGCSEFFFDASADIVNPIILVVVPGPAVSRIILAFPSANSPQVADFMRIKGLFDRTSPKEKAFDLLELCELFMVVSSDHWCARTSAWEAVPHDVRASVETEIDSSSQGLEMFLPYQIFPDLMSDACLIPG